MRGDHGFASRSGGGRAGPERRERHDHALQRTAGDVHRVGSGEMTRAVVLMSLLIGVLAAGCTEAPRAAPSPVAVVKVEPVIERDVPISVEYVGSLVGYVNAQIRARVAGHLMSQNYTEGSPVKAGDLLFQVDPRPFQAAADQADAKLNLAESQLSQAKAQVSASQAQVE